MPFIEKTKLLGQKVVTLGGFLAHLANDYSKIDLNSK
jgi:hypothetical protein